MSIFTDDNLVNFKTWADWASDAAIVARHSHDSRIFWEENLLSNLRRATEHLGYELKSIDSTGERSDARSDTVTHRSTPASSQSGLTLPCDTEMPEDVAMDLVDKVGSAVHGKP